MHTANYMPTIGVDFVSIYMYMKYQLASLSDFIQSVVKSVVNFYFLKTSKVTYFVNIWSFRNFSMDVLKSWNWPNVELYQLKYIYIKYISFIIFILLISRKYAP